MNKDMVYENVLAGSFIYVLGVVTGKKNDYNTIISDSINFFQQTPTDKQIGDLLANWSGKMFIIEFKRAIDNVANELLKKNAAALKERVSENNTLTLEKISKKVHFLGYGDQNDNNIVDIKFNSYLEALNKNSNKNTEVNLNCFLGKLQTKDNEYGTCSEEEFNEYLNFLIRISTKNTNNGKSNLISGILINITTEGKVFLMRYSGYTDLMLQLNPAKQLSHSLNQDEKPHKKTPKIKF